MAQGQQQGANQGQQQGGVSLAEATQAMDQAKLAESEQMAENIAEALGERTTSDGRTLDQVVGLEFNANYVVLRMSGALLFNSGSADLRPEAERVISQVALIVQRYAAGEIQIEGHTDNVPMRSSGKYSNNDELSAGRAYTVFKYLIDNTNVDPTEVIHAGRGEYVPIADNSTAAGRALNRRVEIKLFNSLSSN
jgi:chemotaxis protein MotB